MSLVSDALRSLGALRHVGLVSVDSALMLSERLSFELPILHVPESQREMPEALSKVAPDAFPLRFLDAQVFGSQIPSVGLALFSALESREVEGQLIGVLRRASSYSGLGRDEVDRALTVFNKISIVGCIGDLGCSIFVSKDPEWPSVGLLDTDLLAGGMISAEEVDQSWDSLADLLDWYLGDIPASTGSSWRFVDRNLRQFKIEYVE